MSEENKSKGYISLYRSIQDHWLWDEEEYPKLQAWLDLLLMVNHKDKKTLIGGNLVTIERGSKVTSIRQLSERWGWSNTKVNRFLDNLEADGMITKRSDTKKTVLSIENYDFYQGGEEKKRRRNDTETTRENSEIAANGENAKKINDAEKTLQSIEFSAFTSGGSEKKTLQKHCRNTAETTQKHTNNNDNNSNNANKSNTANAVNDERFKKFYENYPVKKNKQAALKAFRKLNPSEELFSTILTALEVHKKSDQWTKDDGNFIPHPSTWLNQRRWEDEVKASMGRKAKGSSIGNFDQREYSDEFLEGFVEYAYTEKKG